ncbi:hypothetical protein [Myroides odoratus]|uniref:hypothetical protein n=1 Tax=Myroides odoratus TaxID=256 RepID=UPI0007661725|nr:hypothetical protein [Myroides odoratus]
MSIEEAKELLKKLEALSESEKERLGIPVDRFFIIPSGIGVPEYLKLWDDEEFYINSMPSRVEFTVIGVIRSTYSTFAKIDLNRFGRLLK